MPYLINQFNVNDSKKISRAAAIVQYLCENIDNNQDIKRLCRYLTPDPLADYAIDYGNNVFMQPDLNESLMSNVKNDKVSPGCEKRILFRTMFSDKVAESLSPLIYVYCDEVSFFSERGGSSQIGTMLFYVDIVYDISTEELIDWQYRSWTIGQAIMNMFDEIPITDEKYAKEVGNIKFKCVDIKYHNSTNKVKYMLFEQITQ